MGKDTAVENRAMKTTLNMVYLIQELKQFSEKEPITLRELSKKCDFCSINTLRNLLEILYIRTNDNDKYLDFKIMKYTKSKDNKFIPWDDNDINKGKVFYYGIEFNAKKSEIKLLTDALVMFPYLNPDQTIRLVKTIERISSPPDTSEIKAMIEDYTYKASNEDGHRQKYSSGELFNVIELINQAIKEGKCVKFDYYMYAANPEKTELVFSKRSEKIFHPAFFTWSNGFYYIVGKEENLGYEGFMNLRVDRIRNVEIRGDIKLLDMDYINPAKYRDENPVMHGGRVVKVGFRAKEDLLNVVVDTFGKNIVIKPTDYSDQEDNEYVIVEANSSIEGAALWLVEYCNHATAIEPQILVEKVRETLKKGLSRY